MNKIDQLFNAKPTSTAFVQGYAEHLSKLLAALDTKAVAAVIEAFLKARENGNQILFIGNGGSAATASHFANDIAIGTRTLGKPFRAISLTDNVAVISAIGNDFGYEEIFVQQLQVVMRPGDLVVAISASGNSKNLLKAVDLANKRGNTTIGLTGFDGGELLKRCKLNVHIASSKGEYGPVEDMHMILDHIISNYLMRVVAVETSTGRHTEAAA